MSSSSSIAAARRRRAGGTSGPTPPQTSTSQNRTTEATSQSQTPTGLINPLVLLQQHHVKITVLEQMINDISLKQSALNVASTDNSNSIETKIPPTNFNINELSDLIINKVEEQLELKVFYENDEKLMNEIEGLKEIIQSQQMVINGLNNTLYTILGKLNISSNDNIASFDKNDMVKADTNTNANNDVNDTLVATFPKSVIIDETNNTITEITSSDNEQ